MKIKQQLISTAITLLTVASVSCSSGSGSNEMSEESPAETAEEKPNYENAQFFQSKNLGIDMYLLGAERISPEMVQVRFDLVNNGKNPRSIVIRDKKYTVLGGVSAIVEGKDMPLDEINVNGWSEKKREHQYDDNEGIVFITPDEWQPSMQPGDTYHCYINFRIPSDINYINELDMEYGVSTEPTISKETFVIKPLEIKE